MRGRGVRESVRQQVRVGSVSTPRSSNRTCGFAASGSRRRLTQSPKPLHVTPSATSENNLGVVRLIANLPFCRRFLRPPSTEAISLHRSYPASSVLRASPPSQSARPFSHELPVDPHRDHRWDFPCCVWSPFACMPSPIPRQVGWNLFARTIPLASAFPRTGAGRLLHCRFRGLLRVHSRYRPPARPVAQRLSVPEASSLSFPPLLLSFLPAGANHVPGAVNAPCLPPPSPRAPPSP